MTGGMARPGNEPPPPRWRCMVRSCRIAGVWQQARTNDEADRRARLHYMAEHYRPCPSDGQR